MSASMVDESVKELDPASQRLVCPHCGTSNPAKRRFCASCGTNLWEPCPECQTLCINGERFCGQCGANLDSSISSQVQRYNLALSDAEQLQAAGRYDEAIALLAPLTKSDHPRLKPLALRAEQLIRGLTAQRQRRQIMLEDVFQRAEQSFAAHDYQQTIHILGELSLSLYTPAMKDLLERAVACQEEVALLEQQLQQSVHNKRFAELSHNIERLLALKPGHPAAEETAERLNAWLIEATRRKLTEHAYDEALGVIEQVSTSIRRPQLDALHSRAEELACLKWDLCNAPVIDRPLPALAERLRIQTPDDEQTVKLCAALRRRVRMSKNDPRSGLPAWAKPPRQTALGLPVDWLTGFNRLEMSADLDKQTLLEHPGRFYTACGLALGGLRQAAMSINLLRNRPLSMFAKMQRLMQLRSVRSAWGIDLGTSALKAVRMTWNERERRATIEDVALVDHDRPLSQAGNSAEEDKLLTETIRTFAVLHPKPADSVCVGLSDRIVFNRLLELPHTDPAKLAKLVPFETQHYTPLPIGQMLLDFHVLEAARMDDKFMGKKCTRVLVVGAKQLRIEGILNAMQQAGLSVDVMQPSFVALSNFAVFEGLLPASDPAAKSGSPAIAILDVGSEAANMVILSQGSIWSRACGVGGQNFTRAIVKTLGLTAGQAELLKRDPASAESVGQLNRAFAEVLDDLAKDIRLLLAAYAKAEPNQTVTRLWGLGGGFQLHGLFRYLRCGR